LTGINPKADAFTYTWFTRSLNVKESSEPAFHSVELQRAFQSARLVVEGFGSARDKVSNDIKSLEAYLQSVNLRQPFRHSIGMSQTKNDDGSIDGHRIQDEVIAWDQENTGRRFRLLYEVTTWPGHIDMYEYGAKLGAPAFVSKTNAPRVRRVKPLIETKFETRRRLYAHLPDFVNGLAKHVSVDGGLDQGAKVV
jgi:hypothetical protein